MWKHPASGIVGTWPPAERHLRTRPLLHAVVCDIHPRHTDRGPDADVAYSLLFRRPVRFTCFAMSAPVSAQKFDPPPAKTPDAATLKKIDEKTAKLKEAVPRPRSRRSPDPPRPTWTIYVKAAEWIVRHQEWFTADIGKQTLAVIDQGLKRAEDARRRARRRGWTRRAGRSPAGTARTSTARCSRTASSIRPATARTRRRSGGSTSSCTAAMAR